jgi:uncharacterized membrane protein YphA (DoxX/SURF4 family)
MEAVHESSDERLAYALLRLVVGMNLMMHGVSRSMTGSGEFAAKLVMQFEHAPLPAWSVWAFGLVLPSIEGILGVLLLIGLRTRAVLIAASLLIVLLTFGSALVHMPRCTLRWCFCVGTTGGRWMRGWLGIKHGFRVCLLPTNGRANAGVLAIEEKSHGMAALREGGPSGRTVMFRSITR